MEQSSTSWVLFIIVALVIGVGGGYWYGNTKGMDEGLAKGRADLLTEQNAEAEKAKKEAQQKLTEAANPFEAQTNPFEGSYQNPFKTQVNPFAQ